MRILLMVLFSLSLLACASQPRQPTSQAAADSLPGEVMTFHEQRPAEPRSTVRMLVTENFLRIDAEDMPGDFILFDRQRQTIFNVVAEEQSILVMDAHGDLAKPANILQWQSTQEDSLALPRYGMDSAKAVHIRYRLNGQDCHNVVAIAEFLPLATAALREYRTALARNLANTVSVGNDAASLCQDAVFLYEPQRAFAHGFPLREWTVAGYQRFLQDAKQGVQLPRKLFELPVGYQRYRMGQPQ